NDMYFRLCRGSKVVSRKADDEEEREHLRDRHGIHVFRKDEIERGRRYKDVRECDERAEAREHDHAAHQERVDSIRGAVREFRQRERRKILLIQPRHLSDRREREGIDGERDSAEEMEENNGIDIICNLPEDIDDGKMHAIADSLRIVYRVR